MAVGATSGSFSAIAFRLLSDFLATHPELECPICPEITHLLPDWDRLDFLSVLVGIGIGLALGPVVDFLHLLRQSWRVWIAGRLQQLGQKSEVLYRLA